MEEHGTIEGDGGNGEWLGAIVHLVALRVVALGRVVPLLRVGLLGALLEGWHVAMHTHVLTKANNGSWELLPNGEAVVPVAVAAMEREGCMIPPARKRLLHV